jgi:hypothetical protein
MLMKGLSDILKDLSYYTAEKEARRENFKYIIAIATF